MDGYLQLYTGDGKGKTTAALGLLLRAAGAGLRVYLGQFLKLGRTGELAALRARFPEVQVALYGPRGWIRGEPTPAQRRAARRGLARLQAALSSGRYDLVIGDEAVTAAAVGLFPGADLLALAEARPRGTELVLTGRGADRRLRTRADLVTEMRAVRHYYARGVKARRGIEY